MCILFADDNPDIRLMVKLLLERRRPDACLTTVADGEEAVALLQAGHIFDLILLDHHMPPGTFGGVWTLKQVQQLTPQTPVLFLSAYTSRKDIERARAGGASGYLSKSVIAQRQLLTCLLDLDWAGLASLADNKGLWLFEAPVPIVQLA